MQPAAAEAPQEKAVDRAERDLAGAGALAEAGDRVEQPADLGRREIRVDDEAGALGDHLLETGVAPSGADVGGAPVLPDDGVVHRAAGGAVPQHRRLPLVGDADIPTPWPLRPAQRAPAHHATPPPIPPPR